MDTGASHHMTFSRDLFTSFKEWNGKMKLGDDAVLAIKGSGIVQIKMHDGIVRKFDCWFVPGLKKILISLGTLAKNGLKYHGEGQFSDRNDDSKIQFCEAYVKGKQRRVKFSTGQHTSKEIIEYVHSDLWGPSLVKSQGGCVYFVTFIDDYSRKVWVYFLKTKDEVFGKFKEWKTMVEKRTGKQVKTLRTDNGLEFCNAPFDNFCKKEGIVRHRTIRHTPQQNGVAERMNQTLMARARCMRIFAGLSKQLWAEAVNTASYLVNRSPSTAIGLKTPQEVWSGKPSDYSDLRIFGCPAYAHVNNGKHEPRAVKCIFLGYATGVKGYRLWCIEGKSPDKFLISRDVTFDESTMLDQSRGCESFAGTKYCGANQKVVFDTLDRFVIEEEQQEKNNTDQPEQLEQSEPQVEPVEEEADNTGTRVEDSIAVRKGKRNSPKPARYAGCVNTYDIDFVAYALAVGDDIGSDDPKTYKEAVASKDAEN
ncbi:retrovirus-related pol polyprotein from transposon TNT 1-94 [Tanacetum coccineum]